MNSLLLLGSMTPISNLAPLPEIETPLGYELVWHDEFGYEGAPDPAKWDYELGFRRNNERQWYQKENARVQNGKLVIEGRRETFPNPTFDPLAKDWRRSRPNVEYTSACITTRGKHTWQYGIFEMRAKIPTDSGMWPAFWTIGTRRPWPAGGEIDIMEYYRGLVLANVFWGGAPGNKAKVKGFKKPISEFNDPAWSEKFHTWRMEWDEKWIRLYLNGEMLNETDLETTYNFQKTPDGERVNPNREPHFILLNLAIGGGQGGAATQVEDGRAGGELLPGGDPAKAQFPARFEVDYVRIFQKKK